MILNRLKRETLPVPLRVWNSKQVDLSLARLVKRRYRGQIGVKSAPFGFLTPFKFGFNSGDERGVFVNASSPLYRPYCHRPIGQQFAEREVF